MVFICKIHDIHYLKCFTEELGVYTCAYNFALIKYDLRGWWAATPKDRGRSKRKLTDRQL